MEDLAAENMQQLENSPDEIDDREQKYEEWKCKLEKELRQIQRESKTINMSIDSCENKIKKVSTPSVATAFVGTCYAM